MKKNLLFAAIALTALAGCSDNSFVGDERPQESLTGDGAISFTSVNSAVTRANFTGQDAAKKLNYAFVVGGFKGSSSVTSAAGSLVFDNYNVVYPRTASQSNTTGWEYEGLTANINSSITGTQTIKYWDYSAAQYDFIAYSLGNGGAAVTAITPSTATDNGAAGAYQITGTLAQLKTVHIADLKTVEKANYSNAVTLSFRSLASKVRLGLYETIPGYSVKSVNFYTSASDASPSATSALYSSETNLPTGGTYIVYFPTVNDETPASDKNKAHVVLSSTSPTKSSYHTFGAITGNYTTKQRAEEAGSSAIYLGRQSDQRTWTGTNAAGENYYTEVLPFETGTALTLKVDYTLVSIDGTLETINVKGATAVIPAIYTQWKPGYAYTYLFKISDNTNGKTDAAQTKEGLHPITFDAVEVQSEENNQETLTTVATPSITTYQHDPAVNVSANNEYKTGTVYAMVMNGGTLKTDLNGVAEPVKDAAKLFTLSADATEAEVMDALNMYTNLTDGTYTGLNGLVLTKNTNIDNEIADEDIPGPDGNLIEVADGAASKLTFSAAGTYAYVYTVTQATTTTPNQYRPVSVTVGETVVSALYTTTDGSTYTIVGGEDTKAAAGTTYYAKYTQTNQVFAVKVIKVVD